VPDTDTILAVLQGGIGLAGLLLVFSGFLVSKAEGSQTRRGDKYKWLAFASLLPILAALALSWMSADALTVNGWERYYLLTALKIQLGLTALFSIIGLIAVAF
jgi:cytochrome bd-type quinol oxidase subunit 2